MDDQQNTKETKITLDIAKRVQGILLACGHQVVMTRINDVYVSLFSIIQLIKKGFSRLQLDSHFWAVGNNTNKLLKVRVVIYDVLTRFFEE